jgi:hypothetical protein
MERSSSSSCLSSAGYSARQGRQLIYPCSKNLPLFLYSVTEMTRLAVALPWTLLITALLRGAPLRAHPVARHTWYLGLLSPCSVLECRNHGRRPSLDGTNIRESCFGMKCVYINKSEGSDTRHMVIVLSASAALTFFFNNTYTHDFRFSWLQYEVQCTCGM